MPVHCYEHAVKMLFFYAYKHAHPYDTISRNIVGEITEHTQNHLKSHPHSRQYFAVVHNNLILL